MGLWRRTNPAAPPNSGGVRGGGPAQNRPSPRFTSPVGHPSPRRVGPCRSVLLFRSRSRSRLVQKMALALSAGAVVLENVQDLARSRCGGTRRAFLLHVIAMEHSSLSAIFSLRRSASSIAGFLPPLAAVLPQQAVAPPASPGGASRAAALSPAKTLQDLSASTMVIEPLAFGGKTCLLVIQARNWHLTR